MQFANPYILWGLLLLVVPVIIHLFNFRRYRKVYFTNVRQLQEISIKTRKNTRIKHLLVLLLRMIAVATMVFVFAEPYQTNKNNADGNTFAERKIISVFIDNSFSMESSDGNISLLEIAKSRALNIADAYASSDRFQLITNDFSRNTQQFFNKESFVEEVQNITYSPFSRSIKDIITRQKSLLDGEKSIKECFFISDFQKNNITPEQMEFDSTYKVILMPLFADKQPNIYIDSCWFEAPTHRAGFANKLFVKLRGTGNEMMQKLPIRLIENNKQLGLGNFDLAPNGETTTEIIFSEYETGTHQISVEISDHPVTFDNAIFLTFSVSDKIKVMELNDDLRQDYLQMLFNQDEAFLFEKTDIHSIDYSAFNQCDLIILSNSDNISSGLSSSLEQFVGEGGSITVFAPKNTKDNNLKGFLQQFEIPDYLLSDTTQLRFKTLNLNSSFFSDVFERMPTNMEMPSVSQHYHVIPPIGAETLIQFENNDPALIKIPYKKGQIYLFSFSLDEKYTNFPRQALFVPIMLRMAFCSTQDYPPYYTIGRNDNLSFRNFTVTEDMPPQVSSKNGLSFIPGIRNNQGTNFFYMHNNIQAAGFYTISSASDSIHIAYNYDRKESELDYFNKSEIEKIIQEKGLKNIYLWKESNTPIAKAISELYQGVPLWRWFLFIALLALLGEGIILRLWK